MASPLLFLVVSFAWWYDRVYGQSTYECHNASECALAAISDSTTTGSNIECYGYHSCTQATTILSTANAHIFCYGGYSCVEAESIEHTGTSYTRDICCYGSFSCAYVDDVYNEDGTIYCHGELACAESTLTTEHSSIYCYGARSCYGSDLTSSRYFYLYGSLAAQNAILRSVGTYVYMHGYESTSGAELVCSGSCGVHCYGGGCNNFTMGSFLCLFIYSIFCYFQFFVFFCIVTVVVGCEGTCGIAIVCHDAEQSEACPDGYVLPDYLSIPSLVDKEFSTYDNSYKSCYTPISSAVNCDDYQECYSGGTYDENTPMCCTSYDACKLSTSITTNININDSNVYKTAFRADGYYSANQMSGTVFAESGGNIYLAGAYANSETSSTYRTTIKTNGNGDIIVSGYYGAQYKILTQARNLYCLGYVACRFGTISSISGMVYGGGYYSLQYASITDVDGSVYCAAYYSCYETTMANIGENVVCIGQECLYNSNFYNVNNTVAGYGDRSLYSAYMDNVINVC